MSDLLIIFAKSPNAPHVKTRLKPILSKVDRKSLQKSLILDTLFLTESIPTKRALFFTSEPGRADRFFEKCKKKHSLLLVKQEGNDLGERIQNGFAWGFSHGFKRVVIMGSDSPTLPTSFIEEAFHRLQSEPVVLGPALDGGYYLIGMTPPIPDIFQEIPWGSCRVLSETKKRLNRFYLLPYWYDIDYPKDITFLKRHIALLKQRGQVSPIETFNLIQRIFPD
jgi:rSAM/selenodomain-associated transferase 1